MTLCAPGWWCFVDGLVYSKVVLQETVNIADSAHSGYLSGARMRVGIRAVISLCTVALMCLGHKICTISCAYRELTT